MKQLRPIEARSPVNAYLIGAYYMPNWQTGAAGLSFSGLTWETLNSYPLAQPMKGRYHHEGQTALMEEQLAECIRHGIGFLAFDWYHNETTGKPGQVLLNHALDAYLQADARLRSRVKFCVNWITHSGFTPASETEWEACYENWASTYFTHPDYLRIDGRPVVWVFETDQARKNAAGISDRFLSFGNMERAVTVDHTTDQITITDGGGASPLVGTADWPATGRSIQFRMGTTVPTGLTDQKKYYSIKVSQYVGKLANTQNEALAGTAVTFSDNGTSSHKIRLGLQWTTLRSHAYIYDKMGDYCESQGLPRPYIVLGGAYPVPFWASEYLAAGADACSPYNWPGGYNPATNSETFPPYPEEYEDLASAYEANILWNLRNQSVDHIPCLCTGWDNTPWGGLSERVAIGSLGEIRDHFRRVRALMDAFPQKCRRMAIINAWNEYGEGGYAEPSVRYGRGVLEAVREVFAS